MTGVAKKIGKLKRTWDPVGAGRFFSKKKIPRPGFLCVKKYGGEAARKFFWPRAEEKILIFWPRDQKHHQKPSFLGKTAKNGKKTRFIEILTSHMTKFCHV